MKHILLSIFLLLSGSVWGQGYDTNITPEMGVSIVDSPSVLYSDSVFPIYQYFYPEPQPIFTEAQIRDLIRAEIERWWEEKNKPDTIKTLAPYIHCYPDSAWCFVCKCLGKYCKKRQPEPLRTVIDTVRVTQRARRLDGFIVCDSVWLRIDTLYRLSKEQVEKLR